MSWFVYFGWSIFGAVAAGTIGSILLKGRNGITYNIMGGGKMSKIMEIKERHKRTRTSLDVLKGILKFSGMCSMQKDPIAFQKAIWQLKQEGRFVELLNDFSFDESGINPYSDLLDSLIYRLEISGVFGTINPRNMEYAIKIDYLQGVESKFNDDELSTIKCLSDNFKSIVSGIQSN